MDNFVPIAVVVLVGPVLVAIVLWMAGAIYYDVTGAGRWSWLWSSLWIGAVLVALAYWQPLWKPSLALVAVFGVFLVWWCSQKPSQNRDWHPLTAVLPHIEWRDDRFSVVNLRNTDFRSHGDYTPHYETRSYEFSNLRGVDVLIAFWGSPWMSHPMLVFDFGTDGRICISIEVRYRRVQKFSLLRSLYRQQELIYIVCDERDAILHRTAANHGQDCYLYSMHVDLEEVREIFLEYVESINRLRDKPRWYHGLTANCTTSFYRQRKGKRQWYWRLLLNGQLDRALYDRGRLDRSLPFARLKPRSHINEIANRAPREGFGDHLRRNLAQQLAADDVGDMEPRTAEKDGPAPADRS